MRHTVLVFPSSNEPGLEVIQALSKSNKISVLAGSSFDLDFDPARVLVKRHVRCPALNEPDFRKRFEQLIAEHAVELVFPTVDSVVAEFAGWDDAGATFIATSAASARICLSKRATYDRLRDVVAVPRVFEPGSEELPAFAKPDVGSGSRGGTSIETALELALARERGLMVSELLPGPEYTVDCLGDLEGRLVFSLVRVRARVSRGIALGTESVDRPDVDEAVERIAAELKISGPWFAQFKEAADGTPTLLEVNARVGGSMTLSRLAGANLPLAAAFLFAGHPVEVPRPVPGLRINRWLRSAGEIDDFDWVVWDLDDTLVRADGKVDPDVAARVFDFHNQGRRQVLLTRNSDPEAALDALRLPLLFEDIIAVEDKLDALGDLLRVREVTEDRCVMINDSITENAEVRRRYPGVRIFLPDALDALARERTHA
ncbi:MAG: ATP-grasp domain-containing protein [Solirubrobacteraceae bacterium]